MSIGKAWGSWLSSRCHTTNDELTDKGFDMHFKRPSKWEPKIQLLRKRKTIEDFSNALECFLVRKDS